MYGGRNVNGNVDDAVNLGAVWVLSLPSFHWEVRMFLKESLLVESRSLEVRLHSLTIKIWAGRDSQTLYVSVDGITHVKLLVRIIGKCKIRCLVGIWTPYETSI